MKQIFIAGVLGLAALGPVAAHAECAAADDLIARASAIVLAQAVGDDPSGMKKTPDLRDIQDKATESGAAPLDRTKVFLPIQLFDVLEYVKGDGPAQISVTTAVAPAKTEAPHAPAHDAAAFWKDGAAGRGVLTDACSVAAEFEPGQRYLIFIGETHVKAYEEIASDEDPWLAYVKAQLAL